MFGFNLECCFKICSSIHFFFLHKSHTEDVKYSVHVAVGIVAAMLMMLTLNMEQRRCWAQSDTKVFTPIRHEDPLPL